MRTTGFLNMYKNGILTEKYLRCSDTRHEVNHGVLLVGYGVVGDDKLPSGQKDDKIHGDQACREYWVIRNSWGGSWGEEGFFKLCADGLGSDETPLGTCLVNKYAVWPSMDPTEVEDIDINGISYDVES